MEASPWGDFFQRMRLDDHKMSPASQVERVAKRAAAALPQARNCDAAVKVGWEWSNFFYSKV